MAVVKIASKIKGTLNAPLEYIINPDKTMGGLMTSTNTYAYPGDAENVRWEFEEYLEEADRHRHFGRKREVLAFHIVQSFKPGEIKPGLANIIGEELAKKITGDEFPWICATHADRKHVHNHIMIANVNTETYKSFQTKKGDINRWRDMSDELCLKHGLSIIEERYQNPISLWEVYARARGSSTKVALAKKIDEAVAMSYTWDAMIDNLKEMGVKVRLKGNNVLFLDEGLMKRPIRGRTLGAAYTEAALMSRLGRESVAEYSFSPRLLEHVNDTQVRIKVPKADRPTFFIVNKNQVVDHGTTMRLFLPESQEVTLIDVAGAYLRTVSTAQLYQHFDYPTLTPGTISDPATIGRGVSVAQKRYYAMVDRKVEAIRMETEVVNLLANYDQQSEENRGNYPRRLEEKVRGYDQKISELQATKEAAQETGGVAKVAEIDPRLNNLYRKREAALRVIRQIEKGVSAFGEEVPSPQIETENLYVASDLADLLDRVEAIPDAAEEIAPELARELNQLDTEIKDLVVERQWRADSGQDLTAVDNKIEQLGRRRTDVTAVYDVIKARAKQHEQNQKKQRKNDEGIIQ